jgi:hypothetical protein
MFSRGKILLVLALVLFGWGLISLFEARFEAGDVFPVGSSFRSDALGLRAIHEAFAEALGRRVERHRGRVGRLGAATDATIFVPYLSFGQLITKKDPLVEELTAAMRGGARVVVSLDDRESQACRFTYCNEEKRTRCLSLEEREPSASPSASAPSSKGAPPSASVSPSVGEPNAKAPLSAKDANGEPLDTTSCADAALGLWGFEIGGTKVLPHSVAERSERAPASLPEQIRWHSPAKFIELDPAFTTMYERASGALVVERAFGKGSLVLLGESYPLSNEAQHWDRHPELLVWLVGEHPRVIFEESHLGITEPRGVVTLMRELGLSGFLFGCLVLGALLSWQRIVPLGRRALPRVVRTGDLGAENVAILSLIRRGMTLDQALRACIEEAKLAQVSGVAERAAKRRLVPTPETFNSIFCPEQERPDSG